MDESGGLTQDTSGTVSRGVEQARSEAKDVAGRATAEAGDVVGQAKQQAGDVMHEARSQAGTLARDARTKMREQADSQASRVAESLRTVSGDLKSVSECGEHGEGAVASISRELAGGVDRFAGKLEHGGIDGLLDDTRRFARRNPGQFLLGAAALGFIAGRFFRNTDTEAIKSAVSQGQQPEEGSRQHATAMQPSSAPQSAVGGGVPTEPMQGGDPTSMPGASVPPLRDPLSGQGFRP